MASPTGFNYTRKRRQTDPSNRPTMPDVPAALTVSTAKLRVTMTVPCSKNGIPHYAATGGAHVGTAYPTAITVVSPTVFDLTYAAAVAAANVISIPSKDPALRAFNGAYVQPQVKTLA